MVTFLTNCHGLKSNLRYIEFQFQLTHSANDWQRAT